jgi:predicted amidohydrolase
MRLALAQIDTVVGDLDGNRDLILARIEEARAAGGSPPATRLRAGGTRLARADRS